MMQPTEDGLSPDFTSLGQGMPIHRSRPGQGLILILRTWPAKYLGPEAESLTNENHFAADRLRPMK
jgi:hypothetical protein